jgi:hypothetical protein
MASRVDRNYQLGGRMMFASNWEPHSTKAAYGAPAMHGVNMFRTKRVNSETAMRYATAASFIDRARQSASNGA